MKLLYAFTILVLFQNCSFDNKTGIWKSENTVSKKEKDVFSEFETLSSAKEKFDEIVTIAKDYQFKLINPIVNTDWRDIYYDQSNNFKNYSYSNLNKLIFKSKKISKYKISNFLVEEKKLIITDIKGNIITYSLNTSRIISKFNFYKKKYKKIEKILNFIVEDNIIYVSDNLGYLYAFNPVKNKILWAKNYKIPFRSNLKITNESLIAANQNNDLYFFNKKNGDILRLIPTEETIVKNKFVNNLSLNNQLLFFLNTYGSLYAINKKTMKIKWFLNLNQSLDLNPSNLFFGNQIVADNNKVVVSSNQFTYVLNAINGSTIHKKNFSSYSRPIINNDYLFSITKNNLLLAMEIKSGKIIYSYNINRRIAEYLNTKEKKVEIENFMIVNTKIFIFLKNSYILKFDIKGNLENVQKLPSKLSVAPILIDKSLLFLNSKNKILIIN